MSFKTILVPYDNSDHALAALEQAVALAPDDPEVTIHVAQITAPPQELVIKSMNQAGFSFRKTNTDQDEFYKEMEERTIHDSDALKEKLAPTMEGFAGTWDAEVVYGLYTVDTIVDYAKDMGCEVIVMGSRGLGAVRGMLGSVSYGVLRNTDLPVLIVK